MYKSRIKSTIKKYIHRPWIFEDGYSIEDNSQVILYADRDDLFPGYAPRIKPMDYSIIPSISFVLVAVAQNEAETVQEWFNKVVIQTRLPAEIVVVDTGSSDDTVKLLKQLSLQSPVPFRIIEAQGLNISQGRNLAIRSSNLKYVAVTDFGTQPRQDWLERLILPFEIKPETQVSGGWYDAINRSGKPYHWRKWISLLGKDPQDILSPSVSIAFTRDIWEKVGGYPEWLTLTGEDTYFDLELKKTCRWWAFSPEALVDWEAPTTVWSYWKKMYRWAIGDGETGMRASAYWYAALVSGLTLAGFAGSLLLFLLGALFQSWITIGPSLMIMLALILRAMITGRKAGYSLKEVILVIGILTSQAMGFTKGAIRRAEVTRRRLKMAKGIFFILAGIPIDDTGGGSRSTQISLELLRRQYVVFYISKYPKSESVDLNLSIRHPNLFTTTVDRFSVKDLAMKYDINLSSYNLGVLIELPHADWLTFVKELQNVGAKVIYELIDDWDSKLGEGWYSKEVELEIARKSYILNATAPALKNRLEQLTKRSVNLLPNAVNLRLFNNVKNFKRPVDLPLSQFVITYIGSLYGDWFDWDLLIEIARYYTQAALVVIGDYRGQCPVALPNLFFLGLKPQRSLPSYLAYTNVSIIPWKENDITYATSPLKLYEYLAMNVPVVVPNLPPLEGVPFAYLSKTKDAFIKNIELAVTAPLNNTLVNNFIIENSWETRVSLLLHQLEFNDE